MRNRKYVVIRDMSDGNETIGETWQETKIFTPDATVEDVMRWAQPHMYDHSAHIFNQSTKRIMITIAHEEPGQQEQEDG